MHPHYRVGGCGKTIYTTTNDTDLLAPAAVPDATPTTTEQMVYGTSLQYTSIIIIIHKCYKLNHIYYGYSHSFSLTIIPALEKGIRGLKIILCLKPATKAFVYDKNYENDYRTRGNLKLISLDA